MNNEQRNEQKVYDWSDEDEAYIKGLVNRMWDAGLNLAEIKYEIEKIIGVVLFEFEIEKCL